MAGGIISAEDYAAAVARYYRVSSAVSDFAAPQDWMCEPFIIERSGLSVREHQERTVTSYLELRQDRPEPAIHSCLAGVASRRLPSPVPTCTPPTGVDLATLPLTGLGSVCRRQSTTRSPPSSPSWPAAAFACTGSGSRPAACHLYGHLLALPPTQKRWPVTPRAGHRPLPGCTGHKNCANCLVYATRWRLIVARLARQWTAASAVRSSRVLAGHMTAAADHVDTIIWADFRAWERQLAATGTCSHPIRLTGRIDAIDRSTGETASVYDTASEAGGVLHVACGNRRESVCPACLAVYKRDAGQLVRAGLAGGKGCLRRSRLILACSPL